MLVEVRINCGCEDMNVRMGSVEMLYTLGCGQEGDKFNTLCPFCLDAPYGGGDGIAGRQHTN